MTEAEWLADIPSRMMAHVAEVAPASARKLRLLGVAYARYLEEQPDFADAKHVSHLGEAVVEGQQSLDDIRDYQVWGIAGDWRIAHLALTPDPGLDQAVRRGIDYSAIYDTEGPRLGVARAYICCILGNPFRPMAFLPAWCTSTAVALAQGIYDDRAFDRLPILADALQDAGCDSDDVLNHCRDGGPHARGCWVVDAVLGKA